MSDDTLYQRLGGYDGVEAVASNLLPRLMSDSELGRFWEHRGEDGILREKQLLIEFLCASAGGPVFYSGRDMRTTHQGMGIGSDDWTLFISHLSSTLHEFEVPAPEREDLLGFIATLRSSVVEAQVE